MSNTEEPAPMHNDSQPVWDAVIADMKERNEIGIAKYGTPLQPFNGRRPLIDVYQEALDLVVYLKQEILERVAQEAVIEGLRLENRQLRDALDVWRAAQLPVGAGG